MNLFSRALDSARRLTLSRRLVIAGLLAGLASGFAAFVFHELINFIAGGTLGRLPPSGAARYAGLVLLPAGGAALAILVVRLFAPEAGGHGVNEVVEAIRGDGAIPGRVAWVKLAASALTIGSGGSAGREGPIIQIGGAVGSTVGRRLHLPEKDLKIIVAAGATAGLAASFGVPLAAVFFTIEVLLPQLAGESFAAVVIASTVGAVAAGTLLGGKTFAVPLDYRGASLTEMAYFAGLGLLLAPLGVFYMRAVESVELFVVRKRLSIFWTAPLGGAVVGLLAWARPEIMGTSQGAIEAALRGGLGPGLAAAIALAKLVGSAATLGSGAPGGAFMPAIAIGSAAGASVGGAVKALGLSVDSGSMALAGMACVIASAYRAPVTAIVMALEMSRDYDALPPVMLAVAVAMLVSRRHSAPEPVLEQ